MKYKLILFLFAIALMVSVVSAVPYVIPQPVQFNTNYSLLLPCTNNGTDCSGLSNCKLTLTNPNGTNLFVDAVLGNASYPLWNISISDTQTSKLGWYNGYYVCIDGGASGKEQVQFEVTGNGKADPSGLVIALFSVILLIILGTMIFTLFYSVGHYATMDFDLRDLGYNWGILFVFFGVTYLANYYLGNPDFNNFLNPILIVSVWLNGFLSILGFTVSITIGTYLRNKHKGEQNG